MEDNMMNNDDIRKDSTDEQINAQQPESVENGEEYGAERIASEHAVNEKANVERLFSETESVKPERTDEPSHSVYEAYLSGRAPSPEPERTETETVQSDGGGVSHDVSDEPYRYTEQKVSEDSRSGHQYPDGYYDYQSRRNNTEYAKAKGTGSKKFAVIACIIAVLCLASAVGFGTWGIVNRIAENASNSYKDSGNTSGNSNNNSSPAPENGDTNSNNNYIPNDNIPTSGPLTIPQIVSKCNDSVVAVVTDSGAFGSGFFLDSTGTIITNNHIVANGTQFQIITANGTEYNDVTLLGRDDQSDIAVLKIKSSDTFKAVELGQSDNLVVGQSVVAIGNPYGLALQNTVTDGIISAIRENITLGDFTSDLIQTTAAVNNGNSGGPLIDEYGRVIGVVNMKIAATSSEGLGFAIPISTATAIASSISSKGYVSRPMVGISGYYLDSDQARNENLPTGILIAKITPSSDAASKGLKIGDVITKLNGKTFSSMDEFNSIKYKFNFGDTITLTVYREGLYKDYSIVLKDIDEE